MKAGVTKRGWGNLLYGLLSLALLLVLALLAPVSYTHLATWSRRNPDWTSVVHCGRQFPSSAAVAVVVEADLRTDSGHRLAQTKRFDYQVRAPFDGKLSCQRLAESAPCLPLSDIRVSFSSLVEAERLAQLRLRVNGELHLSLIHI